MHAENKNRETLYLKSLHLFTKCQKKTEVSLTTNRYNTWYK